MHDPVDDPARAHREESSLGVQGGNWFGFARGRLRVTAALAYWLGRVLTSFVTTLPLALVLSSVTERLLQGDEALFEAGGLLLLDLSLRQGAALDAALEASIALGLCAALVNFALLSLLLSALAHPPATSLEQWLTLSVRAVPRLLGVSVLLWLSYALVAVCALLALSVVTTFTADLVDERAQTIWHAAVLAPFVGVGCLLQPWGDLSRARTLRGAGVWSSATTAARQLVRSPLSLSLSWAALASLGLLALAAGAALAGALGTAWSDGEASLTRTFSFVASTQLGFAGATLTRLVWLSRASSAAGAVTPNAHSPKHAGSEPQSTQQAQV